MDQLNSAIFDCVAALLGGDPARVPLTYGDERLDHLLKIVEYSRIPEFRFLGADKQPNKRNLMEWLLGRKRGRRVAYQKLFGFAKLMVELAWRPGVSGKACHLLQLPAVAAAVRTMVRDRSVVEKWKARVAGAENPFAANKRGTKVFDHGRHGVLSWHHAITVSQDGSGTHHLDAIVVSLDPKSLTGVRIPVSTDTAFPKEALQPWAESDGVVKVTPRIDSWNGTSGGISLDFQPALRYGAQISFRWGYSTPKLFGDGAEYYRFDINNPTASRRAEIHFPASARLTNVRTLDGLLKPCGHGFLWEVWFPRTGAHEARFDLAFGPVTRTPPRGSE